MAKKSKKKYLIDTSAVRPAIASSTPTYVAYFRQEVEDGTIWTSVYVRKEFIRRWFCDTVRMALTVAQCSDVSSALAILEQDFSIRNVKGAVAVLSEYLRNIGPIANVRAVAEEFASLAVRWLKTFDKVFTARIGNSCRCQIGARTLAIDYDNLLKDLHVFYEAFLLPVTDCEVNKFLGFDRSAGQTARLLSDDAVVKLKVGKDLATFVHSRTWITCKECSKIGDVIVAMEQPSSWCLVHVDRSFVDLCRVLGRDHKLIKSLLATERLQAHDDAK